MKPECYCDECGKEFSIDELSIEESTLTKRGKAERVIVQYFRCPSCKHKYIVTVFDDDINVLNKQYQEFLKAGYDDSTRAKFQAKNKSWKSRINAEASMLHHLYLKQHRNEG